MALVPAVAVVVHGAVAREAEALHAHQTRASLLAHSAAAAQQTIFDVVRTDLELLAEVDAVRTLDGPAATKLFASLLVHRPYVVNVALVTPDGGLVASGVPPVAPQRVESHPILERAVATGRFVVADGEIGPVTGVHVLPTALAVRAADGKTASILVAAIRVASLEATMPDPGPDPGMVVGAIDRGRRMLFRRPDPTGLTGTLVPREMFEQGVRSIDGPAPYRATGLDGIERTYAVADVAGYPDGPVTVVGIATEAAGRDARAVLLQGLSVVAAFAVASAALAWWVANPLIFREYAPLLGAVRKFAAGDASARTGLTGRGEIAEIGRAFDEGAARSESLLLERDAKERALHSLARRLQRVRDEEQARIARELHDEFGQVLTALRIGLQSVRAAVAASAPVDEPLLRRVEHLSHVVDHTFELVRKIASELRPPLLDHLGLPEALRLHLASFEKTSGLRATLECDGDVDDVDADSAFAAFRICQEALTNVGRHAAAKTVRVRLAGDGDDLVVEVMDDGRGFDLSTAGPPTSLGILGMQERAAASGGTLDVRSGPGEGTRVKLRIPRRRKP